jgi:hypothetical protein
MPSAGKLAFVRFCKRALDAGAGGHAMRRNFINELPHLEQGGRRGVAWQALLDAPRHRKGSAPGGAGK